MASQNSTSSHSGFTLIELLVVIAIIVTMAALLVGGLGGTGKVANLQSAQSLISNVITTARAKAISSQRRTRIIFHADAGASQPDGRFLHFFSLQQLPTAESEWRIPGDWVTIKNYTLPEGIYVLPFDMNQFAGLIPASNGELETDWRYVTGNSNQMGSRLFKGDSVIIDLQDGRLPAQHQGVMFTERGTISQLDGKGGYTSSYVADVVIATGRIQSPDTTASGGSPIVLTNSNEVRAVQVSTYGVPLIVNNREDF